MRLKHIAFSHEQHDVLLGVGRALRVAAALFLLWALAGFLEGILSIPDFGAPDVGKVLLVEVATGGLELVVVGLFAFFLLKAASALSAVVDSDEDDQGHLVVAARKLRNVFLLKSVALVVVILSYCLLPF